MSKNKFLLLSVAMMSLNAWAQAPSHPKYVEESKEKFYDAYNNWKPGTPLYDDVADDEEFYISRVKPKTRFANAQTQVDPTMDSERKLLWWCPVGMADGGGWKATPSFHFDSEVFSMWSYVDIYGHWTAPMVRMEGAFADACHKNGVRTSTLASVPWAATITAHDGGHGQNMRAMIDGGADKMLKFLRYYGIDGIGYNSEFSIGQGLSASELKDFLSDCFAKREAAQWPTFTNEWYSLMSNGGSVGGTDYLSSSNKDWFDWNGHPTSDGYFMNYNWGASALATSEQTANSFGRSSYDVYGGMDFQGRSVADWKALKDAKISVGIWGAHNMNMIFETRGEMGSTDAAKQKAYQLISENVFTGSTYNPVNDLPILNKLAHSTTATNFHGFSKFVTARSVLASKDLANEPFVTYFNLGNGTFFNVQGERQNDNEWYNIGVQDYLPTWRWWWTTEFMGRDTSMVPAEGMKAEFTWDDAWFGGSCLAISGKAAKEYLHLFKTKYELTKGDKLTIRYKVLGGSGSMAVVASAEGDETKEISAIVNKSLSYTKEWAEKTIEIGNLPTNLKLADKTMAMLALRFENTTADFKVLIGEISLTRGESVTPNAPTITKSMIMASNYMGADVKVIFKMKDRDAAHPENPIYNEDVDTWYFKIYTQQKGGEQVMCTATTSWAGYVVGAPFEYEGTKEMRIGVSAVSLDGKTESEITWSEYIPVPKATLVAGIEIDKPVIKANEDFTVKFIDPTYPAASKWEILDAQTQEVIKTEENATAITTNLPSVGIYDLRLTTTEGVQNYQALIQISPDEVGAMPQINTLQANDSFGEIEIEEGGVVNYKYTGRKADGYVSRGARLSEVAFGVPGRQLGFNSQSPFTIAFWFCPTVFNHASDGTHMLNIRSANAGWPQSDWGYIWTEINKENKFSFNIRKGTQNSQTTVPVEEFTFQPNQWYHIAVVVDWKNGRDVRLYVNGRYVSDKVPPITDVAGWDQDYTIMMGGKAFNRAGFDGNIDEFKIYNKGLNAQEVIESMQHTTEIPAELVGYWDFEQEPNENNELMSTGSDKNLKGFLIDVITEGEGRNVFAPRQMVFGTGAPFIAGENYKIETVPSWKLEGANITVPAEGNGEAGKIQVTYPEKGKYDATLTLTNGWGSVSKTFSSVTVGTGEGIAEEDLAAAYEAYPNPFYNDLNVRFATEGNYTIYIYNANGALINRIAADVEAGEELPVVVNGGAGVYFINVVKDGKIMDALKVIKR